MRQSAARNRVNAVGAVLIVLSALTLVYALGGRTSDPLRSLADQVRHDKRGIEPRLSGFAWAPLSPSAHEEPKNLQLASAIGTALSTVTGDVSPTARHTAGVAHLLAGQAQDAMSALAAAAASSGDPRVWSDLSATYFVSATRYDAPELLAESLGAADNALAFDPRFPEALFNRALTIERLGLRDDAARAWNDYLAVDANSQWANEARSHRSAVAPEPSFRDLLDRHYARLTTNSAAAHMLARQFPQDARTQGVVEILGRWAEAEMHGNRADADRHLHLARDLGAQLHGERTLQSTVAAIDAASDAKRFALATAHLTLRTARTDFQNNHLVEAEAGYRAAVAKFEEGGSPAALLARNFVANAAFERGRAAEAEKMLAELLATAPADMPAHRAQVLWQIAVCSVTAGRWGETLRAANESIAIFERLGEIEYASIVRGIVAYTYDQSGDPATAWKHRMIALPGVGRRTHIRLQKAVDAMARAAMLRRKWQIAASFLSLEIDISRRVKSDAIFADGLLFRAAVRQRTNDRAGARSDLAAALVEVARISDASYRVSAEADCAVVRAMVEASPHEAIALVTQAIEFHSTRGDRTMLPSLLLQRSRAYRDAGDFSNQAADLEHGIAEIEQRRESLPEASARWGVFHPVEELFDDATDVALRRQGARAAFAIVERARARSLLDSYGRSPSLDGWSAPAGTTIVSYATLPSKLIIFTADTAGIRAITTHCDRETLESESAALIRALRADSREAAQDAGAALYRRLVEPIETQLADAKTIVFIGNGALATIPFGNLVDRSHHYLVERFDVLAAPSAAVFAAAAERRRAAATPRHVLIVTRSGAGSAGGNLSAVAREADRVARSYRVADRLDGNRAQPDDLQAAAASADAIHFAGHAVGDDSGFEPASIVLSDSAGKERRVGVAELSAMRLKRTSVVVLAGCGTARGESRGPEGVISVAHGFLAAGAPSVIATLWPIEDDAAAEFFPRVHAKLAAGMAPAEALRAVQLECIRQQDVPLSLWAAVQVIGS